MDFQLLKVRLGRIKAQKAALSPQDILMLVTQEKADLQSGFFSRLFTVSVPKKWSFSSQNSNDIALSLALIDLIEDVLIPHYRADGQKYAWMEQCILFRLKYQSTVNLSQIIHQHLTLIENSEDLQLSRDICRILYQRQPNALTLKTLAKVYKKSAFYTDAIGCFEEYFEKYQYDEFEYFQYIDSLIERKNLIYSEKKGQFSDVQYALYLLFQMEKIADTEQHQERLNRAHRILLPQSILDSRATPTNIFADMGRSFNQMSKGLGKAMKGRESDLPHSDGIIGSAPKLLRNPDILKCLEQDEKAQQEFKRILSDRGATIAMGAAASGYSLGLIWDYAHIDHSVLDALTFASKGNPENFSTLQDISVTTLEKAGAVTRLSGYVAEQQVAYNLHQQGYVVEFPKDANQAGYDLIVDGTPMQVKCSMSSDYVLNHFDRYPDIPVIVNSELAEKLGDHPMVMVDSSLSYADVQETTHQSLTYLSDFDGLGDALPLPLVGIAFAAYRNYGEYDAGKIDAQKYAEKIGKEAVVVAGGALIGKLIGGTIGGLGGPVGIAIGGGIGAYIGGIAGSTGANTLNREMLCDQRDIVVAHLIEFAQWFNIKLLLQRVQHLQHQLNHFEKYLVSDVDQIVVSSTLLSYQYEAYQRATQLYSWMKHKLTSGNEMEKVQAGWVALAESTQFMSVELRQKIDAINVQLEIYERLADPKKQEAKSLPQLQTI